MEVAIATFVGFAYGFLWGLYFRRDDGTQFVRKLCEAKLAGYGDQAAVREILYELDAREGR